MKINKLTLFTPNIIAQTLFYGQVLGLKIEQNSENKLTLKIGTSILEFVEKQNATPYHFAFNIPANQENLALKWLKSKVEILKFKNQEIQEFEDWNAKAIYFYDADQNIVEFISRKNLNQKGPQKFSEKSLLEISEIGLSTSNLAPICNKLLNTAGLGIYDGNFTRFCAMGSENGLFICVNNQVKKWFPTNDEAVASPFEIIFQNESKSFKAQYQSEKLKVTAL